MLTSPLDFVQLIPIMGDFGDQKYKSKVLASLRQVSEMA